MNRRAVLPSILLAAVVFGQDIHLKKRTIATGVRPVPLARRVPPEPAHPASEHLIVQFDHPPGVEDLDSLAGDGDLVSALPDNAVVLATRAGRPTNRGDIRWMGVFDPDDKISPVFSGANDDVVEAVVEFHGDIGRDRQDALLTRSGITWDRPPILLSGHVLVRETVGALRKLAEEDDVAYVFPADPELSASVGLSACAGMLTMSGPIAQYANVIHGWDLGADHIAHLSYVFGALTPKVPASTVQTEVVRAMNEWSRNASVVFEPGTLASAARTILVKFVSGAHGDAYPFDGPGGTLAHTFYPVPVNPESIAGDVHLDADENWHAGGDVDIYSVALHEMGHAIGLGHSDKPGDVMYPYYRRGMVLSANDVGAVRTLYPTSPGQVAAPPVVSTPVAALRIAVDPVTPTSAAMLVSAMGSISGGIPPWSVQWQSDQGYTGKASVTNAGSWTTSGISLLTGSNTVTFTGFDAVHRTASQTLNIVKPAPPAGTSSGVPISISISSPIGSVITVSQAVLTVSGTSKGGAGVTRVAWQTAAGATGTALGTDRWTAAGIPLLTGTNTIVVRAYDANGNSGWASIVVVRR